MPKSKAKTKTSQRQDEDMGRPLPCGHSSKSLRSERYDKFSGQTRWRCYECTKIRVRNWLRKARGTRPENYRV